MALEETWTHQRRHKETLGHIRRDTEKHQDTQYYIQRRGQETQSHTEDKQTTIRQTRRGTEE